ncbi:hypothetical protein CAPTEDRAFT_21371 [Capitella teleta]|uniref:Peroxiredoxin-5 n=1 Tax=Capitella teleta TaxID=283909 RepID=R7TY35_CAPTE|nr:hypothetical protein CAPTEDRAFT_21371 [Capitella teleta]|eukprot:ELT95870.1 hypothetical protein CAPTEDRAFT_21371 [Capitella teleta]
MRAIQVGDPLPSVPLFEKFPGNEVLLADLIGTKKAVVFAVPGAFTPGCTRVHLPGYVDAYDKLRSKGIEVIACIAVNDPFVVTAWGNAAGATGKIRMLSDPRAEFTKAIGMDFDARPLLGTVRSKRYSMLVEQGKVVQLFAEPDGGGLTCSLAPNLLSRL